MATQMSAARVTLRGDGPWRGLTTLSKSAPFQYLELENGYVSSDGAELRTFPGYLCVLDPTSTARTWAGSTGNPLSQSFGFIASHFAARRRGYTTATPPYSFEATPTEQQIVWTRPTYFHCMEQLNTRWVYVGESDFVREPIYNASSTSFVKVISYADNGAGKFNLTLDVNPLTTANTFNAVTVGDRIHLEGLTGAGAAALNGKGHNVTVIAGAVVTIDTATGVVSVASQSGYIDRVTNPQLSSGSTPVSDDVESLTIWTTFDQGSVVFPAAAGTMRPAHVANRQRDFGDATGNIKQGNSNAGAPNGGRSRRRQKGLPYRLVPHVAGNRIVLVAPGYGCVFQAPGIVSPNFDELSTQFGVNAVGNDIFDQPRCLGIPKGVMWQDPDGTVTGGLANGLHTPPVATDSLAFGGTLFAARRGIYQIKIAYKDEGTGEMGLVSEPISVDTNLDTVSARVGIRLFAYFPGYLMHECLALSINVYRTAMNGSEFFFDRTVRVRNWDGTGASAETSVKYGLSPSTILNEYYFHAQIDCEYTDDATIQARVGLVPVIEQMPMGAKAARTARGFTAFGGALGNSGSRKEMMKGTLSLHYDGVSSSTGGISVRTDRLISAFTNNWTIGAGTASFQGAETGFGCAGIGIPPAYMGQDLAATRLLPHPRKIVTLDKLKNTVVGTSVLPSNASAHIPDLQYSHLDSVIRPESDLLVGTHATNLRDAFLLLPRSRLQISEPDHPGVTPATNVTPLANESDYDIEGIGDSAGRFVVATRDRTYAVSFSGTPIGVPPDIVSDKFGCVGANTMVSFDGGCAWISSRGPVVMADGVVFIGAPLEKSFVGEPGRYLRDNGGMLRYSWACHDAERHLLYFGVFVDRATAAGATPLTVNYRGTPYNWTSAGSATEGGVSAADQVRSRFPCDEVLVYSYKADAWSVWRPPLGMGIKWMTRGLDSQGNYRVFFMDQDGRLYVLDDAYGNGSKESFQTTITDVGPLTTLNVTPSGERSWVGLKVVIYKAPTATEPAILRGTAEVVSQTVSTITLSSAITVASGDKIIVGAREMTIHSTFANIKDSAASHVVKIGIRHQPHSLFSAGVAGAVPQQSFASAVVRTEELRDGVLTAVEASFTRESIAAPTAYRWLEQDDVNRVHEQTFDRGRASGPNHQAKLSIIGGAQVRLHDLYLEVQ